MPNAVELPPEPDAAHQPKHVLVVEDEVLIRSVFADQLRDAGLRVIECASADDAWHYLTTGGLADVIFSDIVMPGAMDGNELARRVNETFPRIKIILTSGNLTPAPDVRVASFAQKPYHSDRILALILQLLGTAST